jgi:hypothetical protein
MARFDRINTSKYELLNGYECYLVKGTLSLDDAAKLNKINRKIVLIFENTKGQNSGVIASLNPSNIKISIYGGLDYLHKDKYNTREYIERTFYTPGNLSNIIKTFESIKRKIPYSWNETQKCMYVYKTLVEKMHYQRGYESDYENGIDVARTLNGVLANRAVCSGFALIFKETMDRLGIECYYQNQSHSHSWNAVKLDGETYLLDLTWDVTNKQESQHCGFAYFCRQDSNSFYSHKYHDLSSEKEEIRFASKGMSDEELLENYKKIVKSTAIYSKELQHYTNAKNQEFDYMSIGENKGFRVYIIRKGDDIDYYYIDKDADIRKVMDDELLSNVNNLYDHNISRGPLPEGIKRFRKYTREDGSVFLLHKTDTEVKGNVNEYILIEPSYRDGKKVLKRSTILSESNLMDINDRKTEYLVANGLLSKERLERKVKHFNGYVGYVTKNFKIVYDRDFEIQELGIQQRM